MVPLLSAVTWLSMLWVSQWSGGGPMSPSTLPQVHGGDGGGGTLFSGDITCTGMGGGGGWMGSGGRGWEVVCLWGLDSVPMTRGGSGKGRSARDIPGRRGGAFI